ncbi:ROK family protein (putative glucokinase) [Paenibacillus sp. UNCCL117]|uniref:ROK family transcriptional regulator n=1 Tax=unclassified Paenibacillus TaxID=185978 RepID=UPI00087E2068|nr:MULTISPECIES: ROK family transcriptional regulator [unclassified Paenibacillus]SDC65614.1 ROK family protein (putative glucokinase) [Paenibacillus sp. cl123]SFW22811.1 ROK family protein (putative glucokinase) [Paenibacillus sp. UNCCL117]
MKITGDYRLMKKINKYLVLDMIRKHFPISRADISARTGLNKATVSALVNELIESGFASETGLGESSGGRKPMMLLFNERAGFAIGVDLGVNYMLAVLTDLSGRVVKQKKIELAELEAGAVTSKLKKTIRALIADVPPSPYGIIGIGVGVPGLVDDQGSVLSAPNLGWADVPLQTVLADEFGLEVVIDNEANAGALGEKEFGAGQHVSNLLYISVGMGIGAGIILHDALYRGVSGFSGEVGHMALAQDGPLCGCGNRGCWETFASEKALLLHAQTAVAAIRPAAEPDDGSGDAEVSVGLDMLIRLARQEDSQAQQVFAETGRWLGTGIANLVNVFNPELIVIGGPLSLASAWIKEAVHESLDKRSLAYHRSRTSVAYSQLGHTSGALGAASLAIQRFFSSMKATWE